MPMPMPMLMPLYVIATACHVMRVVDVIDIIGVIGNASHHAMSCHEFALPLSIGLQLQAIGSTSSTSSWPRPGASGAICIC